jgi:hypothetical protein
MTHVITIPPSLDDATFETVIERLAPLAPDARVIIDARHVQWASPYGLTALLALAQTREVKPSFVPPEAESTLSYWSRMGFFRHAEQLYELGRSVPRGRPAGESSVLLEITAVSQAGHVHEVVERIQERSTAILRDGLGLDARATIGFSMSLSEACQNIVEHAGRGGWVAVQTYTWKKRLGRRVVVMGVCDAGVGFRKSLEQNTSRPRSDRWDDAQALEQAVLRNVSRFRDTGRGQGLAGIRRYVSRIDGKLSVRSGTARINYGELKTEDDLPMQEGLPFFPGAQVQIIIPEAAPAPHGGAKAASSARAGGF